MDGETDRHPVYINNVRSILTHVKNKNIRTNAFSVISHTIAKTRTNAFSVISQAMSKNKITRTNAFSVISLAMSTTAPYRS